MLIHMVGIFFALILIQIKSTGFLCFIVLNTIIYELLRLLVLKMIRHQVMPPTKAPSISLSASNSSTLLGLTEPP